MFDVIENTYHVFVAIHVTYVSFKPDGHFSQDAIWARERCIADIRNWMIKDRLPLNNDKTEVSLVGTKYQLNNLDHSSCLHVGGK